MSARSAASCWRGPAWRARTWQPSASPACCRPSVLLDGDGRPVRRSIQQSDGRVAAEVEELRREIDEAEFLARTGNGINQQLVATKLRWLRRHEPEALARASPLLRLLRLHRRAADRRAASLERNWALESGFFDLAERRSRRRSAWRWAASSRELLPPVTHGHEVIGEVTRSCRALPACRSARRSSAGCADHIASAFVAGVNDAGDVPAQVRRRRRHHAGDADAATRSAAVPRFPPRPRPVHAERLHGRVRLDPQLVRRDARRRPQPRRAGPAGRGLAAGCAGPPRPALFPRREDADPRPAARGALVGLGLHHDVGDIWRALLEAVAYGLSPSRRGGARDRLSGDARAGLGRRRPQPGLDADHGRRAADAGAVAGRAIRARAWVPPIVAGMGVGAFASWREIERFVTPSTTVEPVAAHAAAYDALYAHYRRSYQRLRPGFAEMHGS